ncbi:BTB/POZ domain-containing protein 3-like [Mytilus galloprovincialis]|uniref:BTB domain-containing protein n=1 Tax=Mytilus galloprovincialis TaxID=29158 RepID=A0A8B6C7Y0_MYTGA|nr:Hypothetical predicted protein [Mytilus galloprovincialis]
MNGEADIKDWQDGKTLSECMIYMLEKEIMCDVTLRVGDEERPIKAHKYMMSSRSPVFYTMFEGSMPETGDILIPDIDLKTFREILKYIYTDQVKVSNDNVKEMLYASDKYMLSKVKRECETLLKKSAVSEHATKSLQTACEFHLDDLKEQSMEYIEQNTKKCLLSEHAISLSRICVEEILKSEKLNCSENDVCAFLLKWGIGQCEIAKLELTAESIRETVGDLIFLIRFPVVDMEFFSKEIAESGLLTEAEVIDVYQSHFGVKKKTFISGPREPVSKKKIYTVGRHSSISHPWGRDGVHALTFKPDVDIWLRGVHIFNPVPSNSGHNESITVFIYVLDTYDDEVLLYTAETCYGEGYGSTSKITFPKPARILAERDYTIKMHGIMALSYYGSNCRTKAVVPSCGVTITFGNSPHCTSGTNVHQGQFASLVFSL